MFLTQRSRVIALLFQDPQVVGSNQGQVKLGVHRSSVKVTQKVVALEFEFITAKNKKKQI